VPQIVIWLDAGGFGKSGSGFGCGLRERNMQVGHRDNIKWDGGRCSPSFSIAPRSTSLLLLPTLSVRTNMDPQRNEDHPHFVPPDPSPFHNSEPWEYSDPTAWDLGDAVGCLRLDPFQSYRSDGSIINPFTGMAEEPFRIHPHVSQALPEPPDQQVVHLLGL